MIVIFSKSNKVGSKLIRWGMKHPTEPDHDVSHMAIMQGRNPDKLSVVIDARLSAGVDITWLKSFLKHNTIEYAFAPREKDEEKEAAIYNRVATEVGGKDYDWKAIGFFAVSIILSFKILCTKLPLVNKWADKEDFFCSEILTSIESWLTGKGVKVGKYGEQMLTPNRAADLFIESPDFINVTHLFEVEE